MPFKLKANFHLHTADDPRDKLKYFLEEAVDCASAGGFDVLALTCHDKFAYKEEYADYAAGKNILLIPGIEATIEGRHVVVLNCDKKAEALKTFKELEIYKKENPGIFILAPHPFVVYYPVISLGKKFYENSDLFDAVELTIFSNRFFNFNKKAEKAALNCKKPLLATSDTHCLKYFERGYFFVDAKEKTIESVLNSVRSAAVKNVIAPLSLSEMFFYETGSVFRRLIRQNC